MAMEYKLPYTAKEIDEKLGKIDKTIQYWQPYTEYKKGDYCLWSYYTDSGDNTTLVPITYLMSCEKDHTSNTSLQSHAECWKSQNFNVECAIKDGLGRYIVSTYATKEEVTEAIGQALEGDY